MSWIDDLVASDRRYAPPCYGDQAELRCIVCAALVSRGGCEHEIERDYIEVIAVSNRDRCGACGRFLRNNSRYANRCDDCWTPASIDRGTALRLVQSCTSTESRIYVAQLIGIALDEQKMRDEEVRRQAA